MRKVAALLVALLILGGCYATQPVTMPPAPAPAPAPAPTPGPIGPPVLEPTAPGDLPDLPDATYDAIRVGMTAGEVEQAIGSAPIEVPGGPLPTVRWAVSYGGEAYLLWVLFDAEGRATTKGLSAIRTIERKTAR